VKPSSPSRLSLFVERVLPIGILLVALVGAPVLIFSPQGLPRLRGLEREQQSVADENKALEREIDELHGRVDRFRDDPRAVEEIARDDLGMVRQSEVVFQFAKKKK
jgi:cell division protein FtsB